MAVLVVGGGGFIGRRVVRRLAQRRERVACMDLNLGMASLAGMEGRVKAVQGDVTRLGDLVRVIQEEKPDRIINLAYLLGGGERDPHVTMRLNILGMDNCFEAARLCGVPRVIYASSIAVSGPQSHFGDRLVDEDDPTYGTSQYAVHKIFNEFQAKKYTENYGMSITGIRPANVTGPDKVRGSVDHVQCITLPSQGKPARFPYKSLMRLPIHVEDVAEAFVRVSLADSTRFPIYNTGGTPISIGEVADLVRQFLPDSQIAFDDEGGLERSGAYLVDNSRLCQEFELELPAFRTRVLGIINDVRREGGLPPVTDRDETAP